MSYIPSGIIVSLLIGVDRIGWKIWRWHNYFRGMEIDLLNY
jgi:hypothetical protein